MKIIRQPIIIRRGMTPILEKYSINRILSNPAALWANHVCPVYLEHLKWFNSLATQSVPSAVNSSPPQVMAHAKLAVCFPFAERVSKSKKIYLLTEIGRA